MKRKQRGTKRPSNARTVRGKSNRSGKSKTPRKYYTGGSMY